jgi:hypothetical protein
MIGRGSVRAPEQGGMSAVLVSRRVSRRLIAVALVVGALGAAAVPAFGVARRPNQEEKATLLAIAKEQMDATSIVRWRVSGVSAFAVVRARTPQNQQRTIVLRRMGPNNWATKAGPGTSSVGCAILTLAIRDELGERMLRPCEA